MITDVVAFTAVQWSGSLWLGDMSAEVLYAARRDPVVNNTMLSVSIDGGAAWYDCEFKGLAKPGNRSSSSSSGELRNVWWHYTPLVADDYAMVVAVHDPDDAAQSNRATLYVADMLRPSVFVESLRNVKQLGSSLLSSYTDFEQLQGIDGVFIANRFSSNSTGHACVQSVMSIDMGASWQLIDVRSFVVDSMSVCLSVRVHMRERERAMQSIASDVNRLFDATGWSVMQRVAIALQFAFFWSHGAIRRNLQRSACR